MIMYNEEFLKRLHADKNKTVYIKITSLSLNDEPKESIEGRCTGGSINVDGASAVRRSCSLTLNALEDDLDITDTYWAFDNKFKLEIGLQNDIDSNYPEVIWFEQGVYIINSFSKSRSTTSLSISISGQDKMCRLNGTIGGSIPSEVDFGTEQLIDADGNTHIEKLPIYKIIQSAVRKYGEERLENIIINDLDENGWDLWEYRGEKPMYLIYQLPTQGTYGQVVNMTFNEDTTLKVSDSKDIKVSSADIKYYSMNTLDPDYNTDATKVYYNGQECAIAKIEAGDTAGYHAIPLVYNTDLILKAGETVTSLLDKLKTMLGNFEYYYDLQGRFVFQKKNTYMQELFSPINGEIIEPTMLVSPYSYKFDNLEMITQLSDSPKVDGVKNDFSIWGKRKGATGNDLPIHGRYAIDKKPQYYQSVCPRYSLPKEEIVHSEYWKESMIENIEYWIANGNPTEEALEKYDINRDGTITEKDKQIIEGLTPMTPFYSIEEYDWRELIYQMAWDFYQGNEDPDFVYNLYTANPELVKNGLTGYEAYYEELQGFWRQLYNPEQTKQNFGSTTYEFYDSNSEYKYWNKAIHTDPNSLNFWFDFLDPGEGAELSKYSVPKIGRRPKVDSPQGVTSIYYKDIPEVQFIVMPEDDIQSIDTTTTAYRPIWIQDNMKSLFTRSTQGASVISKVNEYIYLHTCCAEGLSMTAIPIYNLVPNTRIYIEGKGDYTLDKILYNLNYNGTMQLTCTKIIKQFY